MTPEEIDRIIKENSMPGHCESCNEESNKFYLMDNGDVLCLICMTARRAREVRKR